MGAGKCRLCWLPPMGGEVLVPAYAAVRGRSRGHTESGGPVWATDYPRIAEFGGLSGALLGPASLAQRLPQGAAVNSAARNRIWPLAVVDDKAAVSSGRFGLPEGALEE